MLVDFHVRTSEPHPVHTASSTALLGLGCYCKEAQFRSDVVPQVGPQVGLDAEPRLCATTTVYIYLPSRHGYRAVFKYNWTGSLMGVVVSDDLATRNPACWMKCLLNSKRENREASSPVEIQDPPWKNRRVLVGAKERIMGSMTFKYKFVRHRSFSRPPPPLRWVAKSTKSALSGW
jgi:hypothetical protein